MFRKVWEIFVTFCLFALIFYAGAMTGVAFENRRMIDGEKRVEKLESQMRECVGKITMLEAVGRRK